MKRAAKVGWREGIAFRSLPCPETPWEDVCGFRIEEVLAVFGGEEGVRTNCLACPANAAHRRWATAPRGVLRHDLLGECS